jgi:hypothetical protein
MIPISFLLIIFLFFVGMVLLFTFFNIYHMMRFGKAGLATLVITTLYVAIIGTMTAWSIYLMFTVDWTQTIDLMELFFPPSPFGF